MTDVRAKLNLAGARLYPFEIYASTLTLGDAREIAVATRDGDVGRIYEVIGRRLSCDVNRLLLKDFWHVCYWQRINSYAASPLRLRFRCPHCRAQAEAELRAASLVLDDLDPQYEHGLAIELPSRPGDPLPIRLNTVGDETRSRRLALQELRERPPSRETLHTLVLAHQLSLPEAEDREVMRRFEEIRAGAFSADDLFKIEEFNAEFDFGPRPFLKLVCGECREVAEVGFSLTFADFFPGAEPGPAVRARILPRSALGPAVRRDGNGGFQQAGGGEAQAREGADRAAPPTRSGEGQGGGAPKREPSTEMTRDRPLPLPDDLREAFPPADLGDAKRLRVPAPANLFDDDEEDEAGTRRRIAGDLTRDR